MGDKNFTVILNDKPFLNILEARQICQNCGADLVVLENESELNLTYDLSRNISTSQNHIYIGLVLNDTGNWNWTQISSLKYLKWKTGEPKADEFSKCAVMDSINKTWTSTRCCVNKLKTKMVACSKCKLCMYRLEYSDRTESLINNS